MYRIEVSTLETLITLLQDEGYQTIGPTVREGSIIYDRISSASDLPVGWGDRQGRGSYALEKREEQLFFGYVVGPHSWKKFLFPPRLRLFSATKNGKGMVIDEAPESGENRYAFIGVRPCEVAALGVMDKVMMNGPHPDPVFSSRRKDAFVVAVNCFFPGGNCFCSTMGTGPSAESGYDLILSEITYETEHYFLVESGSARGANLLGKLQHREATSAEIALEMAKEEEALARMTRRFDPAGVRGLLSSSHDHPEWEKVGNRCLTCANCTMVCPTCFCTTVQDVTDLTGDHAERWRNWDSCFTLDFAKVSGGNFRPSGSARYRQWITHKLSSWVDQFDVSGCVGCGRCITWCPVGIDITEEVKIINGSIAKEGTHHET